MSHINACSRVHQVCCLILCPIWLQVDNGWSYRRMATCLLKQENGYDGEKVGRLCPARIRHQRMWEGVIVPDIGVHLAPITCCLLSWAGLIFTKRKRAHSPKYCPISEPRDTISKGVSYIWQASRRHAYCGDACQMSHPCDNSGRFRDMSDNGESVFPFLAGNTTDLLYNKSLMLLYYISLIYLK